MIKQSNGLNDDLKPEHAKTGIKDVKEYRN